MVFCIKCGSENPEGSAYCYKCGTKLIVEEADRKGIAKPNITGKYPLPRADPEPKRPRYTDIYPNEQKLMTEALTPPDDGDYSPIPKGYKLKLTRPRRIDLMIAAAVIVCLIVVATAALLLLTTDNTSGKDQKTSWAIKEGNYADYHMTLTSGSQTVTGTCRITYSEVTETRYVMTFTMSANGHTETTSATVVLNGNLWTIEGVDYTGVTTMVIGTGGMQTELGYKEYIHTRATVSTSVEDDWTHSSGCLLRSEVVYTDGTQMILEITGTNITGV